MSKIKFNREEIGGLTRTGAVITILKPKLSDMLCFFIVVISICLMLWMLTDDESKRLVYLGSVRYLGDDVGDDMDDKSENIDVENSGVKCKYSTFD